MGKSVLILAAVSAVSMTALAIDWGLVGLMTLDSMAKESQRRPSQDRLSYSDHTVDSQSEPSGVAARLRSAGLNFKTNDDGNFAVTWKTDNGRTHKTIINNKVDTFTGATNLREVYAVGYKGEPLSRKHLVDILKESAVRKIGAWSLIVKDGVWYLIYTIILPADADGENLKTASEWCAVAADAMEKKLLGTDDL